MNIKLIVVGKNEQKYLKEALDIYIKRLTHYINFEIVVLPDVKNAKNMSVSELKDKEAELILKHSAKADKVVLLDEKGKEFSSVEFSKYIEKQMNASLKTLAFVVGGAFGFSDKEKRRIHCKHR